VQVRQARQKARPSIKRLGKVRGAAVDALEASGGFATLQELCDVLHRSRPRDLVRRKTTAKGRDGLLVMLEDAGIVVVDGEMASLTENWLERLEEARELGRELEAEELDRERYARERKAYRNRDKIKVDPTPTEDEMREYR